MTVSRETQDERAAALIREGLIDGCAYACGCDRPGNPDACIHADRFAALASLVACLERVEEAAEASYLVALKRIVAVIEAWENDETPDIDEPFYCDAQFLEYVARIARAALALPLNIEEPK